jgi:hypothetical protein
MKCLEFIQMHGNWPVSKRTAVCPLSDNRVEMFRTGCRPGLGAGASGNQGVDPCSGCLVEIMTGFEEGLKTKKPGHSCPVSTAVTEDFGRPSASSQLLVDESRQL